MKADNEAGADVADEGQPNTKVVLDLEAAEEVVDLITDKPGLADEDLLEEALDAFERAGSRIAPEDQRRAADGEVVAVELTPAATEAMERLIAEDEPTRKRLLRRVGNRLRSKIKRARRYKNKRAR